MYGSKKGGKSGGGRKKSSGMGTGTPVKNVKAEKPFKGSTKGK